MVVPNDINGTVMLGVYGREALSPFQTVIVYGNRRRPEGVGRPGAADVADIATLRSRGARPAQTRNKGDKIVRRIMRIGYVGASQAIHRQRGEHATPPAMIETKRPQEARQLEGVRCGDHHGIERGPV